MERFEGLTTENRSLKNLSQSPGIIHRCFPKASYAYRQGFQELIGSWACCTLQGINPVIGLQLHVLLGGKPVRSWCIRAGRGLENCISLLRSLIPLFTAHWHVMICYLLPCNPALEPNDYELKPLYIVSQGKPPLV